jgi:hypothetical protein
VAKLASGIVLGEDEKLVMEIQAELWASSSNPFARLIGLFRKFLAFISGFRRKGFLVITNKRVVEVSAQVNCWCITIGKQVKYILPSSIKELGYNRTATCGYFCPSYHLYYESLTQRTSVLLKGADESGALKVVNAFYSAVYRV